MKKLLFVIIAMAMCAVTAVAQKAVVEGFEVASMDLSARTNARLDLHGVRCALVKVRVIADGVVFRGNTIGEPEKHPGEYWVYLTDGTKMVEIASDTFLPFMYYFKEPLQSGVTYVLTLQAPQGAGAAQPQRKKQNFLALKVTPPSAHVTVDGMEIALENGTGSKLLPVGTHSYRVTAPGYAPHEETVTIGADKVSRTVTLRSVKPHLTVTSATPGTEIFINESRKGTGSWSGELLADSYVIEGRLASHRPNSQTVTLSEGEKRTVNIPALEPITGSLSIDYKPMDASVTVDGRSAGTTPLLLDDLLVGTHRVEISAPGYTSATLTATVTESTPATLTGTLTKRAAQSTAPTGDPSLRDFRLATLNKSTGAYADYSEAEWNALSASAKASCVKLGLRIRAERQDFIISKDDIYSSDGEPIMRWSDEHVDVTGLTNYKDESTAIKDVDGEANTELILAYGRANHVTFEAAQQARAYKASTVADDGIDDPTKWSLPALGQLYLLYKYKKQINTSLTNFFGDKHILTKKWYWSSTELSHPYAWYVGMYSGIVYYGNKNGTGRVRAVAPVPVAGPSSSAM